MPSIHFNGRSHYIQEGESVLDTLLSADYEIPNSCHAGFCQSCIMQVVTGEVDKRAQIGMKDSWQAQGMFLACQCRPHQDIEIRLPATDSLRVVCTVSAHERLTKDVVRIRLQPLKGFDYIPGQHITVWRDEMLGRTYSLASVPAFAGSELELHVKRLPVGALSTWLYDDLQVGDHLQIQGPGGSCFYTGNNPTQNLLLAGTGTGLAPLCGIIQDALVQRHTGEIHLYHGTVSAEGLYLHDTLKQLTLEHPNFHYHPVTLTSEPDQDSSIKVEQMDQLLNRERNSLQGWKVYLCGAEDLVKKLQRQSFLAGARLNDIYTDAFLGAA